MCRNQALIYMETSLSLSLSLWQSEGTLLATGSYDGFARIWTKDGEMALIDVTFTLINVA